ncbi:hypothetical protein [Actinomyces capricornis]|uniref:Uncharacterized protein n=1 Tax=Actinomyces capricornis TaxID=2755559 RepID=A0ABM7UEH6_9ACTO|nr:hypothetical protein [Actinomyces capricornis]BDA65552.1 hypothetical protein MANAM107_23860 [Actinomyces capricornis]
MNQENVSRGEHLAKRLGETLPTLGRASWTTHTDTHGTLADALRRCEEAGDWMGLAETTQGTVTVRRIKNCGIMDMKNQDVNRETVYELRLWQPEGGNDDGVVAHELRWLNGAGYAETTVYENEHIGTRQGWCRINSYLQHRSSGRPGEAATMTSLELFAEEQAYGNTVIVDELFTGRWA